MAFTLKQLSYFLAVAEQGTVSSAAKELAISQSAVTEAVKDLEADLGVSLFERHSRGLHLTQNGHQFVRHASNILGEVSHARTSFETKKQLLTGRLHLGVTALMAGYVMSDLLARYRRTHPAVEISAIEDDGEYLEHLLIGGELDVAVMVTSKMTERFALQSEILEVSTYRLWMPIGHQLFKQESISLEDVLAENLIVLNVDEMEAEAVNLLSALGHKPNIAFRTRSVEAVRSLVATGAGVALLPDLIYRPWSLEGDRIQSRDVSGALPVVQVGMVWRKGSQLSPAARALLTMAQGFQPPRSI